MRCSNRVRLVRKLSVLRGLVCWSLLALLASGCALTAAERQGLESSMPSPTAGAADATASRVELGVNTNKHLCLLQREFLDRSHTTWVRGFVPASAFIGGARKVGRDKPLAMLKAVAASGRKVILAIKWDLDKANWRVPAPDSAEEKKWFAWVDELVDELSGRLAILSVTNEMYADTLAADLQPNADGTIPYVLFQRRLVSHIHSRNPRATDGAPLPLYAGGLHAMHRPEHQKLPATRAVLEWASGSSEVAGLDLHLHVRDRSEMEEGLRFTRAGAKNKPIIVTEFSPVWRDKEHMGEALGVDQQGRKFASRYRLDPGMRVVDYVDHALDQPVPEEQWQAFLASRSWFDPLFISRAVTLMSRYGVAVATYDIAGGLDPGEGKRLTLKSNPWIIHMLYVNTLAQPAAAGLSPVNYGVFDDYVRIQAPRAAECARRSNCPWQDSHGKAESLSRKSTVGRCEF